MTQDDLEFCWQCEIPWGWRRIVARYQGGRLFFPQRWKPLRARGRLRRLSGPYRTLGAANVALWEVFGKDWRPLKESWIRRR